MKRIICTLGFTVFQNVEVYDEHERVDEAKTRVSNITKTILHFVEKYDVQEVIFTGQFFFVEKFVKDIGKEEIIKNRGVVIKTL